MSIYTNLRDLNLVQEEAEKIARGRFESIEEFVLSDCEGESLKGQIEYLVGVVNYGGVSGCIPSLITYGQTVAFTMLYLDEIERLFDEYEMTFAHLVEKNGTIWGALNDAAWFAYEVVASQLLDLLQQQMEDFEEMEDDVELEAAGIIEDAFGAEPWDRVFEMSTGYTFALCVSVADFIDANRDELEDAEKLEAVALKHGLDLEIYPNNGKGHGLHRMEYEIMSRDEKLVYKTYKVLTSDGRECALQTQKFGRGWEEDKEEILAVAQLIERRMEEATQEAFDLLYDFYNDHPFEAWEKY